MSLNRTSTTFVVLAVLLLLAGSAIAADISKSCDIYRGFNYSHGQTSPVGVLTQLTIGGEIELQADFVVTDPLDPQMELEVVGVLGSVDWAGGYSDPLHFSAQVSSANKDEIDRLLGRLSTAPEMEFGFAVFEWDPEERRYYLSFHDNGEVLFGEILEDGGELAIMIDDRPNEEIHRPVNFTFSVSVLPVGENVLHLAMDVSSKFAKQWSQ